ncbi:hypothetical protein WK13_34440 [Burkholderia ubonensis]|uniref:SWIM zinc finger family protein n=1 Tax=Burkholderia ubonensis TaxID=101571 RepID=UPI00075CCB18|nr:SWIM zinc finger family protein [Burkholderia ubonensis]KVR21639.1 hypothetical protein WK13_34440 [Burkholderia ubonensis]
MQGSLFQQLIEVPSSSDPSIVYHVDPEKRTCTCPRFTKGHKLCKHIEQVCGDQPTNKKATMPFQINTDTRSLIDIREKQSRVRLSKNFILRDFLFSSRADALGISNFPSDDFDLAVAGGRAICERVLEPVLERFGRFSITYGYQSRTLIEAGYPPAKKPTSSDPHQWDRGTFGKQPYARVDILPFCVEDGDVNRDEFGEWIMMNCDVDLLMQWHHSNIFCITVSPKPRRVWLEWVKQGKGEGGGNKITKMGEHFWNVAYPAMLKNGVDHDAGEMLPKFGPSATGGKMY